MKCVAHILNQRYLSYRKTGRIEICLVLKALNVEFTNIPQLIPKIMY